MVKGIPQHGIRSRQAVGLLVCGHLAFPGVVVWIGRRGHLAEGEEVLLAALSGMRVNSVVIVQEAVPELKRHQHDRIHPEGVHTHLVDPVLVDLLELGNDLRVLGVDIADVPERVVVLLVGVGEVLNRRRPVVDIRREMLGIAPVDHVEGILHGRRLVGVRLQQVEVAGGIFGIVFAVVGEEIADVIGDESWIRYIPRQCSSWDSRL